ncbi:MAG: glycosyltransferase family 39 protein [Chloroflexi bacterium]|nr:glycosyltransferase family 39 protein [Chloroflexota bacterium]
MRVVELKTLERLERKPQVWLAAIILLAGYLRFWGIDFGLPYTIAPDEPTHFTIALRMLKNLDPNPHWLNYPSLVFYLNALALVPWFLINKAFGVFQSLADIPYPEIVTMGVGFMSVPSEFLLSRGLTALVGTASIYLVYRIGRALAPRPWLALLAALFFAVSPASVYNSHLIRPDTFAVFFGLLSAYWALEILREPRLRHYLFAGIAAGLAVSSKYNMPLIALPIIVAHFSNFGRAGLRDRKLYVALGASALVFFATSPFVLLDFTHFMQGAGYEVYAQSIGGHAGTEGDTVAWYLNFLASTEGLISLLALLQSVRILLKRDNSGLVLLSFPLAYYLIINFLVVRNDRTLLPVLPFLHLLAANLVMDILQWLRCRNSSRRWITVSAFALLLLTMLIPLSTAFAFNESLVQVDSRFTAREWLNNALPPASRLAVESYTPYLDTLRYTIQGVDALIDHAPDWYVQNGFEYLIASEGMYSRFFANRNRYGNFAQKYDNLFNRFSEIKRFNDNGYEIRVFKTNVILPSDRVAARFGNDGELMELVGYDLLDRKPGDPLQLRMFWRALGEKPEPYQLELRLLDAEDREIGKSREDLFQGGGWRLGMFGGEWKIHAPPNIPPGAYRVQVSLIWTRYNYALPAKSWRGELIDPVLLELSVVDQK